MTTSRSTPNSKSAAVDFQEILKAMRPFAKFQEAGWQGSAWEDKEWSYPVLVRYKNGKQTKIQITLDDFERILRAYKMAGGK